jgi:hypothetical protein
MTILEMHDVHRSLDLRDEAEAIARERAESGK